MKEKTATATTTDPRIIVALDFPTAIDALGLVDRLNPEQCRLKIGKEMFTRAGPQLIEQFQYQGYDVFLDLKFHDIPNTVGAACAVAADLEVWMVNVHVSGGRRMLEAALEALSRYQRRPLLIGVTVLTSLDKWDLAEMGIESEPAQQVQRLAGMAHAVGLDGVVCSAQEAAMLRETTAPDFKLVTPGIRPATSAADDQRRVMTPSEAVQAGADYLVIGRPITASPDPRASLKAISAEIAGLSN